MGSPPLPPPPPGTPSFPGGVARIDWDRAVHDILNAVFGSQLPGYLQVVTDKVVPLVVATVLGVIIRLQGELGKLLGQSLSSVEDAAGAEMLKAATTGINDFFGTNLTPQQLGLRGSSATRNNASELLGRAVMTAMFGALESAKEVTPEMGKRNAERFINFGLSTALEGWLGGVLGMGYLTKFFPNWADLDDVVAENLGLGRVMRRVLAPLVDALIVDPFRRDMGRRVFPARFNEAQLARARFRGELGEAAYFEAMAELGWTRERAATLLLLNGRLVSADDILKARELGILGEAEAEGLYADLGFHPEHAKLLVKIHQHDSVRASYAAIVQLARDMYRDRELTEAEFRTMLTGAGRSELEVAALLALGNFERSRPTPIPRGEMEEAFKRGFVDLGELRDFYSAEGYGPRHARLLEMIQVGDRLEREEKKREAELIREIPPESAPRGTVEAAYVAGLIGVEELRRRYLETYRIAAADAEVMVAVMARRRADREEAERKAEERELERVAREEAARNRPASAGDVEAAYVEGLANEEQLRQALAGEGYAGQAVELLLRLARNRRAARVRAAADRQAAEQRAQQAAAERAQRLARGSPPGPSKADMERAFRAGLVAPDELHAFYIALGFTAETAELLVTLEVIAAEEAAAKAATKEKAG